MGYKKLERMFNCKIISALFLIVLLIFYMVVLTTNNNNYSDSIAQNGLLKVEEFTTKGINTNTSQTRTKLANLAEVVRNITGINRDQKIWNEETFGRIKNDSLVIVVQVHNRIEYLKYLIESLRGAKGISNTLLIFSHDFFNEDINRILLSIEFCKVMQIFYPYATQVYHDKFPGTDPNDCPEDMSQDEAIKTRCNNALYPDHYGHYRKVTDAQVKHHWWWKANRVFNLSALNRYEGLVLFLEEDMYVVEDFIETLKLTETAINKNASSECKFISLANNQGAVFYEMANFSLANQVVISDRFGNMGIAFNRSTWSEITDCKHSFCTYDDSNWDFSLQHVMTTCMTNARAAYLSAPRIFHLGICGMHFHLNNCDPSKMVDAINTLTLKAASYLYPKSMQFKFGSTNTFLKTFGGWGDLRDHALCLGMTVT